MRTREPASFWRENAIALVNVLRVLAKMAQWRTQVIKCWWTFYHFAIGRGSTLLKKKITCVNSFGDKECNEAIRDVFIFFLEYAKKQ